MKSFLLNTYSKVLIGVVGLILLVCLLELWHLKSWSREDMRQCAAIVECRSFNALAVDGKPVLYFTTLDKDSTLRDVTHHIDTIRRHHAYATGCWVNRYYFIPSCKGRLVTVNCDTVAPHLRLSSRQLKAVVERERKLLEKRKKDLDAEASEFRYYLNVHGVQDEGYDFTARYAMKVYGERNDVDSAWAVLKQVDATRRLSIIHQSEYTVIYRDRGGKAKRVACKRVALARDKRSCLLQTLDKSTPDGVSAIRLLPWGSYVAKHIFAVGYGGLRNPDLASEHATPEIIPGRYSVRKGHDIPLLMLSDGSPVFSQKGNLLGITDGRKIIGRPTIILLFLKEGLK